MRANFGFSVANIKEYLEIQIFFNAENVKTLEGLALA